MIKFISVVEYQSANKCERMIQLGKKRNSKGFFFEPFKIGYKKVIHIEKLPHSMNQKEAEKWINSKGRFLFNYIENGKE